MRPGKYPGKNPLFINKLKKTLPPYHNRAISTLEVIEEPIKPAKDVDSATKHGGDLGLTDDEVAFHDALAANEGAVLPQQEEQCC